MYHEWRVGRPAACIVARDSWSPVFVGSRNILGRMCAGPPRRARDEPGYYDFDRKLINKHGESINFPEESSLVDSAASAVLPVDAQTCRSM
ncbi:hypothetical protein J6590_017436 [Homalodisca vitripennis]|nr:hypothetical protein J6590_017436 [Homalodisca vitripennis]